MTRTAGNLILMTLICVVIFIAVMVVAASTSGGIITQNAWLVVRSMGLSISSF